MLNIDVCSEVSAGPLKCSEVVGNFNQNQMNEVIWLEKRVHELEVHELLVYII
jgi:hypothetical protein